MTIDIGGWLFVLLVLAALVFWYWGTHRRRVLLKGLKKGRPQGVGALVVVQGEAVAPTLSLPTSSQRVAFYGISIISKQNRFEVSDLSGSFTIKGFYGEYDVDISAYYEQQKAVAMTLFSKTRLLPLMKIGDLPNADKIIVHGGVARSILGLAFGLRVWKTGSGGSAARREIGIGPFVRSKEQSTPLKRVAVKSCSVDAAVNEYRVGVDAPEGVTRLLKEKSVLETMMREGDEIYVLETYIPLGKSVFVAGTYSQSGGKDKIEGKDPVLRMSVSYEDPSA